MAKKKTITEKIDKAEVATFIGLAIKDLKNAVESGSALKQSRVFEDLEKWIGREQTMKFWPSICKQAAEQQ